MKIKILYEDKDVLAINKPSGIAVHPDGKSKEKTLVDWILKNYPRMKNVGEPMGEVARPGIVHRLDKETSGVLILAKNQTAHQFLKKQFGDRKVKKIYNTIVEGFVKNDRGVINKPIGRSPKDFRKWLSGRGARGELRDAITEYKVLKRFNTGSHQMSYLEVSPRTGRTHQIRVHMKYINHPVVCDSLYNPKGFRPKGLNRLALHALSLQFKIPKGKTVKVEAPLPKDINSVIK